jgi:hypothetical protein
MTNLYTYDDIVEIRVQLKDDTTIVYREKGLIKFKKIISALVQDPNPPKNNIAPIRGGYAGVDLKYVSAQPKVKSISEMSKDLMAEAEMSGIKFQ